MVASVVSRYEMLDFMTGSFDLQNDVRLITNLETTASYVYASAFSWLNINTLTKLRVNDLKIIDRHNLNYGGAEILVWGRQVNNNIYSEPFVFLLSASSASDA